MCFNPKVVQTYKVINGHPTKLELCGDCAGQCMAGDSQSYYAMAWQRFLVTIFTLLNIDKILTPEEYQKAVTTIRDKDELNLFLEELAQRKRNLMDRGPCPVCNTELRMILSGQRVGCPDCYKHFYEFVRALVIRAQENMDQHGGKTPKTKSPAEELASLEEELKTAAKEERYEDCAKLRDKIREAKARISG